MLDAIFKIVKESIQISFLVAIMMILVDLLNVFTKRKLESYFIKVRKFKQYILSSLIGTIPGCVGGFTNVALWTFSALAVVEFGLQYLHLEQLTSQYKIVFLIVGALVGLLPESGPHLIFVTLFAQELIAFSVLLTSSIVQDGHEMLPMLSYLFKDSIILKAFNLVIGLTIGFIFYSIGF